MSGREFQTLGAAKEKHLWSKLTSLTGGIFGKFLEEDLRFLIGAYGSNSALALSSLEVMNA